MKYALTILAALIATPAVSAEPTCAPFPQWIEFLAKEFGEKPLAQGVSDRGALMVVFTNSETESYTMLAVGPEGHACLLDEGQGFGPVRKKQESNAPSPKAKPTLKGQGA